MKTIQTTLLLLTLLLSLPAATFGQEAKTSAVKVTHLGSINLKSIKLGIGRLDDVKKTLAEGGIDFAKQGSPLETDRAVEVEFVQCELSAPVSMSAAANLFTSIGYRPATFEEAASIDETALEKVAGKTVYALGTQMMLGNGDSLIFHIKYPLAGPSGPATKGAELVPVKVPSTWQIEGTVIFAMIQGK